MGLLLTSFFGFSLFLNMVSLVKMRKAMTNDIAQYVVYREETEIAIKY